MFKRKNYTKWIPLGINTFARVQHVIFVRRSLDNGLLQFKSKKVQKGIMYKNPVLPIDTIDVKKQWNKIMEEDGK